MSKLWSTTAIAEAHNMAQIKTKPSSTKFENNSKTRLSNQANVIILKALIIKINE